jgi:hypothetical protein
VNVAVTPIAAIPDGVADSKTCTPSNAAHKCSADNVAWCRGKIVGRAG